MRFIEVTSYEWLGDYLLTFTRLINVDKIVSIRPYNDYSLEEIDSIDSIEATQVDFGYWELMLLDNYEQVKEMIEHPRKQDSPPWAGRWVADDTAR